MLWTGAHAVCFTECSVVESYWLIQKFILLTESDFLKKSILQSMVDQRFISVQIYIRNKKNVDTHHI